MASPSESYAEYYPAGVLNQNENAGPTSSASDITIDNPAEVGATVQNESAEHSTTGSNTPPITAPPSASGIPSSIQDYTALILCTLRRYGNYALRAHTPGQEYKAASTAEDLVSEYPELASIYVQLLPAVVASARADNSTLACLRANLLMALLSAVWARGVLYTEQGPAELQSMATAVSKTWDSSIITAGTNIEARCVGGQEEFFVETHLDYKVPIRASRLGYAKFACVMVCLMRQLGPNLLDPRNSISLAANLSRYEVLTGFYASNEEHETMARECQGLSD